MDPKKRKFAVEEWSADEQPIVDRLKRTSAPYVTLGILGYDNLLGSASRGDELPRRLNDWCTRRDSNSRPMPSEGL